MRQDSSTESAKINTNMHFYIASAIFFM